jgi:hypothetical protein
MNMKREINRRSHNQHDFNERGHDSISVPRNNPNILKLNTYMTQSNPNNHQLSSGKPPRQGMGLSSSNSKGNLARTQMTSGTAAMAYDAPHLVYFNS